MEKALELIGPRFDVSTLEQTRFVKPVTIRYDWKGGVCTWDMVESHTSVGVVLFHRGLSAFLVVRQFRPAVYATACRTATRAGLERPPFRAGFTYEICAGIIDKPGLSIPEICKEEVAEECGYNVDVGSLVPVAQMVSSVGISGTPHDVYFTEVDESMRIPDAGGGTLHNGEYIEVLALPFEDTQEFLLDNALPKSPSLMFGLMWGYHEVKSGRRGGLVSPMETGTLELGSVLTA